MKHPVYESLNHNINPVKVYSDTFHSLGVVFRNNQNNSLATEIYIKIKLTGILISGVPRIFFSVGGGQKIQLRTENTENGYLGA